MSRESGITTMSLIIYIIAMMVVIGIIATITSFFYTNVNSLSDNSDNISEITKFHMYFLSETTKKDNAIVGIDRDKYITFASGNTFTFQDNSIYLNHIRICEDVYGVKFDTDTVNSKTVVKVLITIGNYNEYTRTTEYVLNIN